MKLGCLVCAHWHNQQEASAMRLPPARASDFDGPP
jgi:hypothetical protein